MLISNKSYHTIYIEVASNLELSGIELLPLEAGEADVFTLGSCIHVYSEIGTCIALDNPYHDGIISIWNFGTLILEDGPKKNSGSSIIVRESEKK